MAITLTADQVVSGLVGFFSVSGAVVYGLKKRGLLTFGQCDERRNCSVQCGDHENLIADLAEIKKQNKEQSHTLNDICQDLAEVVGYLRGKDGFNGLR
jgi:hypothetical protein